MPEPATNDSRRTLRVGVAGLGFGAGVHVPALKLIPGVEVVAIAGTRPDHVKVEAARLGVPAGCIGFDDLLDRELDAVCLALPPAQNCPAAAKALDRGLAVLSEKPLATTAGEALDLAARAEGAVTAVDFQFAELQTFRELKARLDAGEAGCLRHVQVSWMVESWAQKNRSFSWKTDAGGGGGVIAVLVSHLLYLIEHLFGRVHRLHALTDNKTTRAFCPPDAEAAEDVVHLLMELEGGVTLSATVSNASPGTFHHRYEIVADGGTYRLFNPGPDYMAGFSLDYSDREGSRVLAREPEAEGDGRLVPFLSLARRFFDSVVAGTPVSPDFADGARVQVLSERLVESARTRSWVETYP